MPILDPSLAFSLLNSYEKFDSESKKDFFVFFLSIASKYLYRDLNTVKASIQFKKDLKDSSDFLNLEMLDGINKVTEKDLNIPTITNYYQFLYDKINNSRTKSTKISTNLYGIFKMSDQFDTQFFQPFIIYPDLHAWYFTSTPIAILCINTNVFDNSKNIQTFFQLVNLEIDLMIASGFTIVLCIDLNLHSFEFLNHEEIQLLILNILYLITDHPISEIHFSASHTDIDEQFSSLDDNDPNINFLINKLNEFSINNKIYGYLYLYVPFIKCIESLESIATMESHPKIQIVQFSRHPIAAFKPISFIYTQSFVFCKVGFEYDEIQLSLSNVPIFDGENDREDYIPSKITGLSYGYINKEDFLCWKPSRIRILYVDQSNKDTHVYKYINYDDIHLIRPDLYVSQALYLTDAKPRMLNQVNQIINDIKSQVDSKKKFKRNFFISAFINLSGKNIATGIKYVSYAYTCYERFMMNPNFCLRQTQLFTILDACKNCILNKDEEKKGIIYQIDTGEGKTCIISIIAAYLALKNKTVHITSSNIVLARRDFTNSYLFFKMLGLKSAILLHQNELPNDYRKSQAYKNFYDNFHFKNSTNMNIVVCDKRKKVKIVFSTFVNFESYYLRMMEFTPGAIEKYFKNCALLIDEADSILIDELMNGTIMSHSIKSNAKNVLKFVYKNRNYTPEYILGEIKKRWPECEDISLDNIKDMYHEMDIVIKNKEFRNRKKYLIKEFKIKKSGNIFTKISELKENIDDFIDETKENAMKIIKEYLDINDNDDKKNNQEDQEDQEETDQYSKLKDPFKDKDDENHEEEEEEEKSDDDNEYLEDNEEDEYEFDLYDFEEEEEEEEEFEEEEEEEKAKNDNKKNTNIANEKNKETDKKDGDKIILAKHIVPFDYKHKGVVEPNKEFSGFIHQFIAIREMTKKKNKNMHIKNLSMNYMYVSHPIFANLYGSVCGFTGTLGGQYDQKIFDEQYQFKTAKIPRHNPNYRVDLPVVLCSNVDERNEKIVNEIIAYHKKEFPVLVIFLELKEMENIVSLLEEKGIKDAVNIFDGKDEKMIPDYIAGVKSAISLGTNVCARGTNIEKPIKPLHIIVTYFTANERVMGQAFGRTARQGREGSTQVICLENEFFAARETYNDEEIKDILNDFSYKNKIQIDFINRFKNLRGWIFEHKMDHQYISSKYIRELRKAIINVNRTVAVNFEFPICMSVDTFLEIQIQKIFSLFNCPNCKYTWMLFQKYLREMILEAFSLTINKIDSDYKHKKIKEPYKNYLESQINILYEKLEKYLPSKRLLTDFNVIPTYMNIFNYVVKTHQDNIMKKFPPKFFQLLKQGRTDKFISYTFGFKPFSLLDKSGAKINNLDGGKTNYVIRDPELLYLYKTNNNNKFDLFSITKKVDLLFNEICNKINEVIGEKTGLKLFLRRTLGGCEFGICFDFELETLDDKNKNYKVFIDKDPLLLLTISIKSIFPLLAGVLIICLIYVANLVKEIGAFINTLYLGKGKKMVGKTLKLLFNMIIKNQIQNLVEERKEDLIDKIYEPIEKYVIKILDKQIEKIKDSKTKEIIKILKRIATKMSFSEIGGKINDLFNGKTILKLKSKAFTTDDLPTDKFFKLGLLLLLCLASFIMNFTVYRQALNYDVSKNAADYDKNQFLPDDIYDKYCQLKCERIKSNQIEIERIVNSSENGILQLTVDIIEAYDLPKIDIIGWCNPYVKVYLNNSPNNASQTSEINNVKETSWNQSFDFYPKIENKESLILELWNKGKNGIKDALISKYTVGVNEFKLGEYNDLDIQMNPKFRGNNGGKLKICCRLQMKDK